MMEKTFNIPFGMAKINLPQSYILKWIDTLHARVVSPAIRNKSCRHSGQAGDS
jgi:hypothetical protein